MSADARFEDGTERPLRLIAETIADLGAANPNGVAALDISPDGKLVVCSKDAFTVHCLDAATGKALWQFAAAGRCFRLRLSASVCG